MYSIIYSTGTVKMHLYFIHNVSVDNTHTFVVENIVMLICILRWGTCKIYVKIVVLIHLYTHLQCLVMKTWGQWCTE